MARGPHWNEFDRLGPIDVRRRIEQGIFGDEKRKDAYAWLDETERGADRAVMVEQARVARSAARAAWVAAITATIAAITAIYSIPGVSIWVSGLISSYALR